MTRKGSTASVFTLRLGEKPKKQFTVGVGGKPPPKRTCIRVLIYASEGSRKNGLLYEVEGRKLQVDTQIV